MTDTLNIEAFGESTFNGHMGGDWPNDPDRCIPLMVKNYCVNNRQVPTDLVNRAVSGQKCQRHLDNSAPEGGRAQLGHLLATDSDVVLVSFGLNDANNDPLKDYYTSGDTVDYFGTSFGTLLSNCRLAGKHVFVNMPNAVTTQVPYSVRQDLNSIAGDIPGICSTQKATLVNSGLQSVSMYDLWHPNESGYQDLGADLEYAVGLKARHLANVHRVTGMYIACFNRTPEKGGLEYWTNRIYSEDKDYIGELIVDVGLGLPMQDDVFVTLVYNHLFGRNPDSAGLQYWIGVMNQVSVNKHGRLINLLIDYLRSQDYSTGNDDICVYNHRINCGIAYGSIYGKTAVAPNGNLDNVDEVLNSAVTFINNL